MTPIEIAAVTKEVLSLIGKLVELAESAHKGELTPEEAKQRLADHTDEFNKAVDSARAYLDKQFDTP